MGAGPIGNRCKHHPRLHSLKSPSTSQIGTCRTDEATIQGGALKACVLEKMLSNGPKLTVPLIL